MKKKDWEDLNHRDNEKRYELKEFSRKNKLERVKYNMNVK
jgi:hypothetical protein